MKNYLILVNERDEEKGFADKLYVHQHGLLHRAFSIVLFRKKDNNIEILLQKRNPNKYHSGNLWSNSCCSHPHINESILNASHRRLHEELNITIDHLQIIDKFIYKHQFTNGLIENELDYIVCGVYDHEINDFNQMEISKVQWINIENLRQSFKKNPLQYTVWFEQVINIAIKKFAINNALL